MKYIGTRKYINDGIDMASIYEKKAIKDEQAAHLLASQGLYSEAIYLYIQSMEKSIKSHICQKLDITQPYYADRLRQMGHSLDSSIHFLIEILSGNNEIIREQISKQILSGVFQGIQFSSLHNNIRYPLYHPQTKSYSMLEVSGNDCYRIQEINECLKRFLKDLYKI